MTFPAQGKAAWQIDFTSICILLLHSVFDSERHIENHWIGHAAHWFWCDRRAVRTLINVYLFVEHVIGNEAAVSQIKHYVIHIIDMLPQIRVRRAHTWQRYALTCLFASNPKGRGECDRFRAYEHCEWTRRVSLDWRAIQLRRLFSSKTRTRIKHWIQCRFLDRHVFN